MISSGVFAARIARQIAAGQREDIIFMVQAPGELAVVDRRAQPEVETAFGHGGRERRADERQHGAKFSWYRRRFSCTCASSFQAAIDARCTGRLIAEP